MQKALVYIVVIALFGELAAFAGSQTQAPDSLKIASKLRSEYNFGGSLAICEALSQGSDTLVAAAAEEAALLARNGLNMLDYCSKPVVIAREKFSIEDFFLYYPLPEKSWREIPNVLDSISVPPVKSTYIPTGADAIIFSAADSEGIRNLLKTERQDSVWSAPELLGEQVTSSGNEIFPMLSGDGKKLYFASSGLYGMGGYDLYCSVWNEEAKEWGTPVNMGFPYSSPADDFLFVNTPDGKYSLFASNRDCGADSVYVYVLEYDSMPVRTAFEDNSDDIRNLSSLIPEADTDRVDNRDAVYSAASEENEQIRKYVKSVMGVQALRDSLYSFGQILDGVRTRFANAPEDEKTSLASQVVSMEQRQLQIEDSLRVEISKLQSLEMEIILSGSVIDPDAVKAMADREVKGAGTAYAFSRKSFGENPDFKVLKPEPTFDYSFMVLPEGRFAEDNTLPSGLVYQIQIFTASRKATVGRLRGLSPVFYRQAASGTYIYSVGVFRSYKDALSKLTSVKKAGFRSAFIVAFNDGAPLNVNKARKMEKADKKIYSIHINLPVGNDLSDTRKAELLEKSGKDLSRGTNPDGGMRYVIGTFNDRSEVERVAGNLIASGLSGVTIEEVSVQ